VVYDEDEVPLEFLSICLDCNYFRSYPGRIPVKYQDEWSYGFTYETRNKLRAMFKKWGFDYYGYAPSFDNTEDYENYLKARETQSN